jgi:hypothetical protein
MIPARRAAREHITAFCCRRMRVRGWSFVVRAFRRSFARVGGSVDGSRGWTYHPSGLIDV